MRREHCCQAVLTLFSLGPSLSNQEAGRTIRIESEQHPDDGAGYSLSNFHFYRTQVRSLPSLVVSCAEPPEDEVAFFNAGALSSHYTKRGGTHTHRSFPSKTILPMPRTYQQEGCRSSTLASGGHWTTEDRIGDPRSK